MAIKSDGLAVLKKADALLLALGVIINALNLTSALSLVQCTICMRALELQLKDNSACVVSTLGNLQ